MRDGFESLLQEHLQPVLPCAQSILSTQTQEGAIPWFVDGPWDPWNHTECVMALGAMGELDAARAGFEYLKKTQRTDGAWFGAYGNTLPMDADNRFIERRPAPEFLDSNFCAYPAVGLYHFYLLHKTIDWVEPFWPMVKRAIDFVLSLQRSDGTVVWSQEAMGTDEEDALLAGNASILKSLECAWRLARLMDCAQPEWEQAYEALHLALRDHPERFDRRGTGARFAMDWYYPVLSGALGRAVSEARLEQGWHRFVHPEYGCRCVEDEPWVTVAETAELALALISVGQTDRAAHILKQARSIRTENGVCWMGWQYEEALIWPEEQPSWTQAAIILASDALHGQTKASQMLVQHGLEFA